MERTGNNGFTRDRTGPDGVANTTSSSAATDFVLQWGNRKRLRCMKVQTKSGSPSPARRTTTRLDRRVVRTTDNNQIIATTATNTTNNHNSSYLNPRQRPSSPPLPPPQRVLRNSETSGAMRNHHSNGATPYRSAQDKKPAHHSNHRHDDNTVENNRSGASSESNKKGGGSSYGSGEAATVVWPPKFVIALTNKEKEEDFLAIKGSKLPQRPKKRAKFIQRTVNLVCPGTWLCDLTLERYEVREKKVSKKTPRGLKAMDTMIESDSE